MPAMSSGVRKSDNEKLGYLGTLKKEKAGTIPAVHQRPAEQVRNDKVQRTKTLHGGEPNNTNETNSSATSAE